MKNWDPDDTRWKKQWELKKQKPTRIEDRAKPEPEQKDR